MLCKCLRIHIFFDTYIFNILIIKFFIPKFFYAFVYAVLSHFEKIMKNIRIKKVNHGSIKYKSIKKYVNLKKLR